jgi:hypothetical protein
LIFWPARQQLDVRQMYGGLNGRLAFSESALSFGENENSTEFQNGGQNQLSKQRKNLAGNKAVSVSKSIF